MSTPGLADISGLAPVHLYVCRVGQITLVNLLNRTGGSLSTGIALDLTEASSWSCTELMTQSHVGNDN